MSGSSSSNSSNFTFKVFGYAVSKLTPPWRNAFSTYTKPGGSAEQRLGKIESVEIKYRDEGPVHQTRDEGPVHPSHFNPKDPADIISVRIEGEKDEKTYHVYPDGTGTTKKGDPRF
ncbi:MAG: hypothetical protein L6R41_006053 [Letrouitia leprolyta]|nr:MAG: hypothetical protein L6R41_006053 [Letrouitia leprolyta]